MNRLKQFAVSTTVALAAFAGLAGNALAQDHRYETRGDHRGDRIDERQQRQAQAIRHAAATGRLTPHETRRLMRQQEQIRHAEAQARADGRVSYRERERLDAMQDHARRSIERETHDRQTW